MLITEKTYRLKLSFQIGYIGCGISLIALFLGIFAVNFRALFTGQFGVMDYASLIFLLLVLLPVGLFVITSAFDRVILRADGIEYHTAVLVLKAKWEQLVNAGYHREEYTGLSLIVVPQDGEVALKLWAIPIQGILKRQAKSMHLSASWFRDGEGNSLEKDIVSYLPGKSPEMA